MTLTIDIPRDEAAPALARDALRDIDDAVDPELLGHMSLLISELVTNSVKYGADGAVRLAVEVSRPRRIRVEVTDGGTGFVAAPRSGPSTEVGGWGLQLVDQLADRWGVYEGSTHVWFEFDR